ncbi:unnamed protein product, partial [Gadus morhua 'NCC']
MPLSTVCRTVHGVVEEMMAILHRMIHLPKAEEMEERPVAIMTPYHPVAGHVEARWNHARGRNIVEWSFGILKTRWRAIFLWYLEIRPVCPQGGWCLLQWRK